MIARVVKEQGMIVSEARCTVLAYLHRLPTFLALTHLDCQGCNRLFHLHHAILSSSTCAICYQSEKGDLL